MHLCIEALPEALISTDLLPRMPAMHVTPPLIAVVRKMCVLCATNTSSKMGRNRSAMILWIRNCKATSALRLKCAQ